MITPDYCRLMARYNGWQNRQLATALESVPIADLRADHGAFFGSILGTLNHVLWGDQIWMSRFDKGFEAPGGTIPESTGLHPTLGAWSAARFVLDGKIAQWAGRLTAIDLTGDIAFYSGVMGREVRRLIAPCVVHMFNHQTHHRGQVHAMMTRTGLKAPVSDIFLMPEDA